MPVFGFDCVVNSARVGFPCLAAAVLLGLAACGRDGAGPQSIDPLVAAEAAKKLTLEPIGEFTEPLAMTSAPDGILFLGERAGVVKRLDPQSSDPPEAVIDLSRDVSTEGEGGLLSIADSPESDEIFVTYAGLDRQLHLEAFTPGQTETAAQKSRREIVSIAHPNDIHWGGHLEFDDRGRLYLSVGEGGPIAPRPLVSQDPDSMLGKLFRLDPEAKDPELEMIALGLRNPWQFSIDGVDIWIGDVGDFQQEEVDLASTDLGSVPNYGWPILEGTVETGVEDSGESLVDPALTYNRTGKPDDPYCAITGGHIIRDPALEPLVGRYIFSDFCQGDLQVARPTRSGPGAPRATGLNLPRIASFEQDQRGHSYAVSLEGGVFRLGYG